MVSLKKKKKGKGWRIRVKGKLSFPRLWSDLTCTQLAVDGPSLKWGIHPPAPPLDMGIMLGGQELFPRW